MIDAQSDGKRMFGAFFETMKTRGANALREAAWREFSKRGLPTRRVESWRYTDLRQAAREAPQLSAREAPQLADGGAIAQPRVASGLSVVIADGRFRHDLSSLGNSSGLVVESLNEALERGDDDVMAALATPVDDAMVALNAALMQDGVVVRVAPGARASLSARFLSSGGESVFTRSVFLVGEGARLDFVESVERPQRDGGQENHAAIFVARPQAAIAHVSHIHGAEDAAIRILSQIATLEEGASLESTALVEGGGLLRRQIFARLSGANARASFSGAGLLGGRSHTDTTLIVDHLARGGVSRERFRTVLDDAATGVFQGKIAVRREAQKTDGVMQSKALLLSDRATMNNKPELEIFADDVLCGHGATCGRLDKEQLFYLTARGLSKHEAETLLIEGFLVEAFDAIEDQAALATLIAGVRRWLDARESAS